MSSKEIKLQLKIFEDKIFNSRGMSEQDWLNLEKEFNDFVKDNNLNADDLKEFCLSGAGEILYMICSGIRTG